MTAAAIKVDVVGALSVKQQLKLLQMGPNRRRRLVARVAKQVIRDSKQRVRQQVDINGRPFPQRYKPRSKNRRKMLSRLVKQLKVVSANANTAVAGFNSPVAGRIAAKQQYGDKTVVRAFSSGRSAESYKQPATRRQARALIDAGFMIKRPSGKGKKKPSIKYIVDNYTQGQAGSTLKRLREWAGEKSKTSWVTTLPARAFLGATAQEVSRYIQDIFNTLEQEAARGYR